jgi:muconate cycloisomerase
MNHNPLHLKRIGSFVEDHALRRDRLIRSPAGVHDSSRFLTVTVEDESGAFGYGEAATTALWSGETAETARELVENVFAPRLLHKTFQHPREALALMDAAAYANPFTKSALDCALWDVWARLQYVPATRLFADREPVREIPTRASVGAYPVAETVRIATEFWQSGIRTLKFKIGVPDMDDAARLRAVRAALGEEPVFTVDANGAYGSADEAVRAIEVLLPFAVALVEQPTHRDRIALLAAVRRRVAVPIMADECVFTPQQLQEALDLDAFDVLSIYPGKNGGFTRALEMAQTAQRAGKACALGSNLETDLGQAAMAALAAGLSAFPVEQIAGDLPAALFYERSSVTEPPPLCEGNFVVPQQAGFGVTPLVFRDNDHE